MRKTSVTASKVARLAEQYLEPYQPADYRILIDAKGVRKDSEGWWEVPIRPSKLDAPSFDWVGRSSEAAVDMDDAEGIHVLFM